MDADEEAAEAVVVGGDAPDMCADLDEPLPPLPLPDLRCFTDDETVVDVAPVEPVPLCWFAPLFDGDTLVWAANWCGIPEPDSDPEPAPKCAGTEPVDVAARLAPP